MSGTRLKTVLPYLSEYNAYNAQWSLCLPRNYADSILTSTLTQVMMFQSGRVADAGYETHWIENVYWRRSLGLLIMRAQKTLKLTGGPFYVISYETLLTVSNICVLLVCDKVQTGRLLPTNRRMKG